MTKIKQFLAALVLLCTALVAGTSTAASAAKDTTWGTRTEVSVKGLTTAQHNAVNATRADLPRKGWPGGSVDYWKYYGGVVRYINYECDGGRTATLWPGDWSKSTCADLNWFFVQSGSKLFCGERYGLRDYVYYPGWHSIGNFAYRACEMRAHNG